MSEIVPAKVGYALPPVETRFKKGQSGNPRGRPRKTKVAPLETTLEPSLQDMILSEAARPIQIQENGKVVDIPMIQAVIRSLGVSAVKGSHRSQMALAGLVKAAQDKDFNDRLEFFKIIFEYKQQWEDEFARCDSLGRPRPDPVPHPDDIQTNHQTLEVYYNGPETPDDKKHWDAIRARRQDCVEEIAWLQSDCEETDDADRQARNHSDIEYQRYLISLFDANYPNETIRRRPGFKLEQWRRQNSESLKRP